MQRRGNIQTAGYLLQLAVIVICFFAGAWLTLSNPDGKPGFGQKEWFGVFFVAYGILRSFRLYNSWKKGRNI